MAPLHPFSFLGETKLLCLQLWFLSVVPGAVFCLGCSPTYPVQNTGEVSQQIHVEIWDASWWKQEPSPSDRLSPGLGLP